MCDTLFTKARNTNIVKLICIRNTALFGNLYIYQQTYQVRPKHNPSFQALSNLKLPLNI